MSSRVKVGYQDPNNANIELKLVKQRRSSDDKFLVKAQLQANAMLVVYYTKASGLDCSNAIGDDDSGDGHTCVWDGCEAPNAVMGLEGHADCVPFYPDDDKGYASVQGCLLDKSGDEDDDTTERTGEALPFFYKGLTTDKALGPALDPSKYDVASPGDDIQAVHCGRPQLRAGQSTTVTLPSLPVKSVGDNIEGVRPFESFLRKNQAQQLKLGADVGGTFAADACPTTSAAGNPVTKAILTASAGPFLPKIGWISGVLPRPTKIAYFPADREKQCKKLYTWEVTSSADAMKERLRLQWKKDPDTTDLKESSGRWIGRLPAGAEVPVATRQALADHLAKKFTEHVNEMDIPAN
jgi:hypothetical protein